MTRFVNASWCLLILISGLFFQGCCSAPGTADIVILGGRLFDGTGTDERVADIAVSGDIVTFVSRRPGVLGKRLSSGKIVAGKVVDASGCIVCPGFIDPHTHTENEMIVTRSNEPYLRMGVTTVFGGMCGGSKFPLSSVFEDFESKGIGPNFASFTGHNTLRRAVMGNAGRFATDEEIARMDSLLAADMTAGSFGLSTGLFYTPGCYSETREVVELCRTVAACGGLYTTHVRNENRLGIGLLNSVKEALEIGREAGVPVNISHIKCLGRSSWYQSDSIISMIESCRRDGMQVTADQYPYEASSTSLGSAVIPSWARAGSQDEIDARFSDPETLARIKADMVDLIYERGGAESILIRGKEPEYKGVRLTELMERWKMSDIDAAIKAYREFNPQAITFVMCPEDIGSFMRQPWVMTGSDGRAGSHPRSAGTFAEKIQEYVMRRGVISIGDMIRRSTGLVAETYGLDRRGILAVGNYADILVFRPEDVRANSDYVNVNSPATGFRYVIVNGEVAVEDDVYTGSLSGKVIRHSFPQCRLTESR